jgi:hypothetical protein
MKTIKIQINNGSQRVFNSELEAVKFILADDQPKPIKTTKKYTVWKDTESFLKSQNL